MKQNSSEVMSALVQAGQSPDLLMRNGAEAAAIYHSDDKIKGLHVEN